jgi:peptidoglycan hydrolase CwlO-like protein
VHEAGALSEAASVHDFNTPGDLESPQIYLLRSSNLPLERFEFETFAVSDLHSELMHQKGQLRQLCDQLEESLTNSQTAIKTVEEARRQQRAMQRPAEAAGAGGAAAAAAEIQRAAAAPAPSTASASSSTRAFVVASGQEQRQ